MNKQIMVTETDFRQFKHECYARLNEGYRLVPGGLSCDNHHSVYIAFFEKVENALSTNS